MSSEICCLNNPVSAICVTVTSVPLTGPPSHACLRLRAIASGFGVPEWPASGCDTWSPLIPHWLSWLASATDVQSLMSHDRVTPRLLCKQREVSAAGLQCLLQCSAQQAVAKKVGVCRAPHRCCGAPTPGRWQSCNSLRNLLGRQRWDTLIFPEGCIRWQVTRQ